MGNAIALLGYQQAKEASTVVPLKTVEEVKKIVQKKKKIAKGKKKGEVKKKSSVGDERRVHKTEVHIMDNAFALLGDQEDKEASDIVALKIVEVKKIVEENKKIVMENKKSEAKKKQEESSVGDGQKSLDGIIVDQRDNDHQHDGCSDGQGNTEDGQAIHEKEAVNVHHGNKNQEEIYVRTVVLEKEELRERLIAKEKERNKEKAERQDQWLAREAERQEQWLAREVERKERQEQWLAREAERQKRQEQWLAREAERQEQWLAREAKRKERQEQLLAREVERNKRLLAREAESKERRLAREEERKKEMARKTLKEYEEQKAYEKQKAENVSLSVTVPETPPKEATLGNIYTKQRSKDETSKEDNYPKKYRKIHKKMNIEEFMKLPTGREGQDGPSGSMGKDSGVEHEYALPDEDNTVKVKAGHAPDLSETSFPSLGKSQTL